MVTISLCMIVKNEEDVLARCLECMAGIADEIVIADTGSTDGTKEIALRYTPLVFDFTWIDDFAAARNFSFSKATCDYIMWLDADDILAAKDRQKLLELKQTLDPGIDTIMMKYCSAQEEDGSVVLSYRRERLVKRIRNFKWFEPVHEYIKFSGRVLSSDITVQHKKNKPGEAGRNLRIYSRVLADGGELSTRGLYYYSRELYYARQFDEAIRNYRLFLSKEDGWAEDKISACNELADCCKLTGDEQGRLESHLFSLKYDLPRAENCCGIAFYHMDRQDYRQAIFWFELVLRLEKPKDCWGFILNDLWDFIPTIQLCVCYDKLGNVGKALMYHELSKAMRPNHPSVLHNQQYFDSLKPTAANTGEKRNASDEGTDKITGDEASDMASGAMGGNEGRETGGEASGKADNDVTGGNADEASGGKANDSTKKSILLGSPVHQKPEILKEFLEGLSCLRQQTVCLDYFFYDDNDDPESSGLLLQFSEHSGNTCIKSSKEQAAYTCNENTHYWSDELIWKVAGFKDEMIGYALERNYDALFLVDSDILLEPSVVEQLAAADRDIVSEVFWTCWYPGSQALPNVWHYDHYDMVPRSRKEKLSDAESAARQQQFLDMLKIPGLYEVGMLGACTLISRKAMEAGISFRPVNNLTLWGEDRHFCVRAAALGYKMYADTHCKTFHIYRMSELQEVEAFKSEAGLDGPPLRLILYRGVSCPVCEGETGIT